MQLVGFVALVQLVHSSKLRLVRLRPENQARMVAATAAFIFHPQAGPRFLRWRHQAVRTTNERFRKVSVVV